MVVRQENMEVADMIRGSPNITSTIITAAATANTHLASVRQSAQSKKSRRGIAREENGETAYQTSS